VFGKDATVVNVAVGEATTRMEPHLAPERHIGMTAPRWSTFAGAAALTVFALACGSAPPAAGLPRTTGQGIDLTMSVSEEVLPLPGCHTQWLMNHDEEPPPGTCERTVTVQRFIAQHGGSTVETSVVGEPNLDTLYAMGLASWNLAEDLFVVVVDPPSDAAVVRLTDSSGMVVDEVTSSEVLVALAGLGSGLAVEALDGDGAVIAACPTEGVPLQAVIYQCTIAESTTIPTTIPADAP